LKLGLLVRRSSSWAPTRSAFPEYVGAFAVDLRAAGLDVTVDVVAHADHGLLLTHPDAWARYVFEMLDEWRDAGSERTPR
jgi:hypothetical protein